MEIASKQTFSFGHLISRAGVYTAGEVSRTIIPTLLLPILTYYLAPDDYGLLASFQALAALTLPFAGLNATRAATWRYFSYPREDMAVYIGNCLLIMVISSILIFGLYQLAGQSLAEFTKFPAQWFWAIPALCAAQFVWRLVLGYWRALDEALKFSIFNVLLSATNMSLSLWLVIALALNWQGRVLGILVSNIGFAIAALVILYRAGYLRLAVRRLYLSDVLNFGAPLIVQNLATWVQLSSSRLFLNNMVGLAATGLYSVGFTLASVLSLVVGGFHNSWIPWIYARLKENDQTAKARIVLFTYTYFLVILAGVLVLTYLVPYVIRWVLNERYLGAQDFIFWAALGFGFHGMQMMMEGYILFENRSGLIAKISIVVGILSLAANYGLIRLNGAIGAAQALAATFFLAFILTWIAANSVHPMPWFSALKVWSRQVISLKAGE